MGWSAGEGPRAGGSRLRARERVAVGQLSAFHADPEPVHALLRATMRERVRTHRPLQALLHRVVADLRGGIHAFLDVPLLEPALGLLGLASPDAGAAIGLQFG